MILLEEAACESQTKILAQNFYQSSKRCSKKYLAVVKQYSAKSQRIHPSSQCKFTLTGKTFPQFLKFLQSIGRDCLFLPLLVMMGPAEMTALPDVLWGRQVVLPPASLLSLLLQIWVVNQNNHRFRVEQNCGLFVLPDGI